MKPETETASTDEEMLLEKIQVGISSCLLGQEVRFDGGHKRDSYVTGTCPAISISFPSVRRLPWDWVFRASRFVWFGVAKRFAPSASEHRNWIPPMISLLLQRVRREQLGYISGYILKNASPSCGMERVKVYNEKGMPERIGVGIYAKVLMEKLPLLPVEEEGRLGDAVLRENFIERVFVYHRWQQMVSDGLTRRRTGGISLRSQVPDSGARPGKLIVNSDAWWPTQGRRDLKQLAAGLCRHPDDCLEAAGDTAATRQRAAASAWLSKRAFG